MSIFRRRPSFGRAKRNPIIPCSPTTLISPLRGLRDSKMSSLTNRLRNFLLTRQSSIWLTILRIGLGLQVLCYGLSLRGDWLELLGQENQGLIRRDLAELLSYGVDNFTIIGLFYLTIAPLPDSMALDARWRGIPTRNPTLHGLHRRVLQFHMCIIYFFGGISKCAGRGWWNGVS